MPKELVYLGPYKVGFREYEDRDLQEGEIKVRTLYSGISHGTEITLYRGTNSLLKKKIVDGIFMEGEAAYKYPFPYGYEEVGEVVEVGRGVEGIKVGDTVAAAYGHKGVGVINPAKAGYFAKIPPGFNPERGVFLALGSVALDAVLTSGVRIGESAVVFGQGVVGLFVLQLLRIAGVSPIIAVDLLRSRLELSKKFGADYTLMPGDGDLAVKVKELTGGRRADVTFETSGSHRALHEAIRCGAASYSKVVALSLYQGGASDLYLGDEFHYSSHLAGGAGGIVALNHRRPPAPGRQWDVKRVAATFFRFLTSGKVGAEGLITHRFDFEDAEEAFQLIDRHPDQCTKVVLCFAKR